MHDSLTRLSRLPLVSACLVDGRAIGGGAELSLWTDFRVFTTAGQLAFVQASMGLSTGFSGGKLLVDLVGRRRAVDILLNCRRLDAAAASEVGLCDAVVDADCEETAVEAALGFLKDIVGPHDSRVSQALTAVCRNASDVVDVEAALRNERSIFAPLVGGEVQLKKLGENIKH